MSVVFNSLHEYFKGPESQKQVLDFCAQVATIATSLLGLIIFIYRKLNNWNNSSKNKTDIELFQKFKLDDEQNLILLNNSVLFSKITKKHGSTLVIETILKCFDPHAAMLLYSKRPNYLKFNDLNYPCRPNYFLISRIFFASQIFLWDLFLFVSLLTFGILTKNETINMDLYFRLIFVSIGLIIFSYFGNNFWWDEQYMVNRAEYFYENFSIYFKKKYKDGLTLISNNKYPLDFEENEWVEFYARGTRQTLLGKIIKIERLTCQNTYDTQVAIIQLNLISWTKKVFYLLMRFTENKDFYKSIKFFLRGISLKDKYHLSSLKYPDNLMKWSCHQYEFLLRLQHEHCQENQENL